MGLVKTYDDDGRGRIPDEAEQRVIADMLRWKREGLSFKQIADKLNELGLPTKRGAAKLIPTYFNHIIKMKMRFDADIAVAASENHDPVISSPEVEPDWLFPKRAHRSLRPFLTLSYASGALDQIRALVS